MKLVKVLIPFREAEAGKLHKVGDEVNVSEDTINRALAINPNMLLVLGDAKADKPKRTTKSNNK